MRRSTGNGPLIISWIALLIILVFGVLVELSYQHRTEPAPSPTRSQSFEDECRSTGGKVKTSVDITTETRYCVDQNGGVIR